MSVKKLRWLLPLMIIALCAGLILPALAEPTFVIKLAYDKVALNVEDVKSIDYTVTASSDVTDKGLKFSSDNETVVKVSNTGVLTGIGVGYANVTIEHETAPKTSVILKVEVLSTSTLTLDLTSATLPPKGSVTLTYTTNAPLPITFSTSNAAVCTVDSAGKVTAVGPGTAEILAANSHGVKATCTITVSGSGSDAPSKPSEPSSPSAPEGGIPAYVNTVSGSLNLRAAQTSDAIILRTIPQNEAFTVLEYGPIWCKAWYNGTTGYVMTQFVRFAGTTPSTPATPSTPTEGITAYVNTVSGSLNLRAGKSTGASVLRTMPQNAAFTLLEYGSGWCKVWYNGTTGYVMTKYVYIPNGSATPSVPATPSTPTTPTTPSTPSTAQFQARVTTPSGSLKLRTAPTQSAARIMLIPRKTIIDVLSFGPDWSYVRYGMHEGYVMSKFLNADTSAAMPDPVKPSTTAAAYAQVMTAHGGLNMRKSASTGSKRILVIPQYAYVEVNEAGTKWCYLTYNCMSGYVQTAYLKMI